MAQKKESKIKKNTLSRHEKDVDRNLGVSIMNDFLQLSKALERLKESDPEAFHAMFCLVEENLELKEEVKERGKRIAKLQKKS
ncbi:hypothetical protein [Lysinibacillus boronitolerans]|uniref:Uncharacterized protein n=1 Tax=Lysinibacillus boronitolerans JCM 21713 = 10a = NBRC 103108 TaxID=1294264 RepID=A0ABR4Y627_9BACI|nr:hypothetical protein [Lysinibacillus boronitolerans]KGR89069.1 hypothetical protein CD31_01485 [Lysinibacillus boronitolerans JCM 21713 = 10a = NBRC 103108]